MRGSEIKRRRQARQMSPQQFAEAVGVSPRTVTNWESGATSSDRYTGRIEEVLLAGENGESLDRYDDTELLAELMARASRRQREGRSNEQSATITALPQSGKTASFVAAGHEDDDLAAAAYRPDEPPAAEREPKGDDGGA